MSIQEIKENLKDIYKERLVIAEEQWPPVRGNKLVNLQLVVTEKHEGFHGEGVKNKPETKRIPILYKDLFLEKEEQVSVRKLLIEGNAGIGKTTLCTMLAEEWAKGDTLIQFDLVLFLPLRDDRVSSAKTLSDLMRVLLSSDVDCSIAVDYIQKNCGKGVLIIADGWDELEDEKRAKDSFFYQLFAGKILRLASVLLTSRPTISANLHSLSCLHRVVEVVGFNEECIKQYIKSEFDREPEKASSLIDQLIDNPVIQSVCSVPLNCAILCNLWHTLNQTLPKTLTELYTQLVLCIILRNVRKVANSDNWLDISLENFDMIPDHLQKKFWRICKFAYDCLLHDRIVFSETELIALFPEGKDIQDEFLCFGLLQSAKSLLPVGHAFSFHFLHLTIQEYLAALHFVTLSSIEKLRLCKLQARNSHFCMFWQFVFGLGCRSSGYTASNKIDSLGDSLVDRFISKVVTHEQILITDIFPMSGMCFNPEDQPLLLCHCALETNDTIISSKIAQQIDRRFLIITRTPFDYLAVCHVLQHSTQPVVDLGMGGCGLDDNHLKKLTDVLSRKAGNMIVKNLSLENNNLTEVGVNDLFKGGVLCLGSLESLFLKHNKLKDFSRIFNHSFLLKLKRLSLSCNPLGERGLEYLALALEYNMAGNLSHLELCSTFTDNAATNGKILSKLLPSLSSCISLTYLDISDNDFEVPGACVIGKALPRLARIGIILKLTNTHLNSEAMVCFTTNALEQFSRGTRMIPFNSTSLILNNNPLGYEGLVAALKLLEPEKWNIRFIDLQNTNITQRSTTYSGPNLDDVATCSLSPHDSILLQKSHNLSLSDNDFSGERISILVDCLRIYQQIEVLYTQNSSLSSDDIINFLSLLKSARISCTSLKSWHLSNNLISDEGVKAIIENMPDLFPSIRKIWIEDNPAISVELRDKLRANCKGNETEKERSYKSAVFSKFKELCSAPKPDLGEIMRFGLLHFSPILEGVLNANENDLSDEGTETSSESSSLNDDLSEAENETSIDTINFAPSPPPSSEISTVHNDSTEKGAMISGDSENTSSLTIETLKTKVGLEDSDLDEIIRESDFYYIAQHFDCYEHYIYQFGLSSAQQADVKKPKDTQAAIMMILRYWTECNPSIATFKTLVKTLLEMSKGTVAIGVCEHLKKRVKKTDHESL